MAKQQRNRWLVSGVMGLSLLAFLGLSLLPLIGGLMKPPAPRGADAPNASPQPGQSPNAADKAKLESEAKGYELVLQREPENETVLRGLIETRLRLNDVKGVIAPLEKLSQLKPDEADYGILLAQAKQQTGDREGAASVYRKILDRQPFDVSALQGLAALTIAQNRPQAAIGLVQNSLDKAVVANKQKPSSADTVSLRLLLGQVYAELRRYDEATAAYDKAIAEDPKNFRPLVAKAIVLKAQNKDQQAQDVFARAASLAPDRYKDSIRKLATEATAPAPAGVAPNTGSPSPAASSPTPSP